MAGWGENDKPVEEQPALGAYSPKDKPASGVLRRVGDAGIALARGVVGLPEAAVGVADLVTGGRAGKAVEAAGVRFKDAKDFLAEGYSPEQQAANANVQEAQGFLPTLGAMVRNPSTIVNAALESAPSMLAGGAASRGVLAIAPKIGQVAAGAIGEGLTAAGQNAEQVRQEDPNGTLTAGQSAILAASGALTGGIGFGAGKLANRLGVGDVQTMMAAGKLGPVGEEAAAKAASKSLLRKAGEGALVEGGLQEAPQSYQEQVAQNIAQGKPLDEGAGAAAAQGLLVGGVTGGLAGPLHSAPVAPPPPPPGPISAALALPAPVVRVDGDGRARMDGVPTGTPDEQQAGIVGRAPIDMPPGPAAPLMLAPPTVTVDAEGNARAPGQVAPAPELGPRETGAFGLGRNSEIPAPAAPPAGPITASLGFDNSPTGTLIGGADGVREERRPEVLARAQAQRVQEGDILGEQGKPFQGAIPAARAARIAGAGHTVVKVADGYVVRQLGDTQPITDVIPRDVLPHTVATNNPEDTTNAKAPAPAAAEPAAAPAPAPVPAPSSAPAEPVAQGSGAAGGAGLGVNADTALSPVDAAAHAAATSPKNEHPEPTVAQKEAGNYSKGHARIAGMDISIENPQGSTRSGADEDGKPWSSTMRHHYGYVRGTTGNDGDQVDVFIKPGTPANYSGDVYVVDQVNPKTKAFDEHKAVIGAASQAEAERIYHSNYAKGWKGLSKVTGMPIDEFKTWVRDGKKDGPVGSRAQPLTVGTAPNGAEPVTVKDGIIHVGKYAAVDFDSGEPVKVSDGATHAQIKQALKDAGALTKRQKFFGGTADAEPAEKQVSALASAPAVDRPAGWRTNALIAGRVAKGLGIESKGKKLADLLGEIDAKDATSATPAAQPAASPKKNAIQQAREKSQAGDASAALDGDDKPQFRKSDDAGAAKADALDEQATAMKRTAINKGIQELTRDWLRKPEIKILDSLQDPETPEAVQRALSAQSSKGGSGTVHGFHLRGTVYIVADAITNRAELQDVLFHESLGHFGLRGFFGKSLNPILEEVVASRKFQVIKKAREYGLDMAKGADRLMAAEEVLAELAQTRPQLPLVQRAIAAIRTWLRAHVPGFADLALTDNEIINSYILPARGFVERGLSGKPTFTRGERAQAMRSERTVEVNGVRHPVENSNGQPVYSTFEGQKNFWKWFGDSKAIDVQGRPLVLFHGTNKTQDGEAFHAFDSYGSNYGLFGQGAYFTEKSDVASTYVTKGRGEAPTVYPAYLSLKNPIDMDAKADAAAWTKQFPDAELFHEGGDANESWYRAAENALRDEMVPMYEGAEIMQDGLRAMGYDGITHVGGGRVKSEGVKHQVYIAFDPQQIKSATGNNGDFDPNDDRVAFLKTTMAGPTNRAYTPDQLRAMDHVGFRTETPSLQDRAKALWKDAGKKLAQGIVDQFAPIKAIDSTAYGLLRLSKGASGAFEAFLRGGKLKLTDGVYDFDETQRGGVVDKLLIPLGGEHHDFFRWVAANRAERLAKEGKENLFSAQDIADLKTLDSGVAAFDYTLQHAIHGSPTGTVTRDRTLIYRDALATFNEFNKNALDLAEQSGLIDGASRHLWEHEFYVPFYRVADEDDGGVRGMNIKSSVVRQEAFKALKGGKDALNADLLDNTLMNWAHLLDAAAKNRAAKATLEAAESMGLAVGAPQYAAQQIASASASKKGLVWFMDGGQKRYFVIDQQSDDGPFVLTALTALEYAGMRNPVMNAMGAFKHALTIGVTASPFFKVRNLIRDSVQAIGTSDLSFNPGKNIAQGWKLTSPKADSYFRLLAGGGTIHFGTMLEGSEAKRVQALVESGVDDSTILNSDQKVKAFYRKFIEPGITAYNELGNRGEAVNRAALYDQLVKQGVNHADASLQARDLMDFSMQGSFTTIRFLTQVVPFFNARLQGLYKLGRSAKEDPARFGVVLGAAAALSVGLLAAYGDDDDWQKREDWDRNNFWWFKFGGMAFRIPKPFEIGAIATLAERGFELAFSKEMTQKRFLQQVLTIAGDNLSMNPVPQLIKPIVDVYANFDSFTDRPIEPMGMDRLKADYRFGDRTSMVARGASTGMNAAAGAVNKEALSPLQIDHLLKGYFGWLGSFIVGATDAALRPLTGQPGHAAPDYWKTLTGGMASELDGASSRYVSHMYQQAKEIEQAYGTWKLLQKEGKSEEAATFREDNAPLLAQYHQVERLKKLESGINQRINLLEKSDLSGGEKRTQILALQRQKDRVARNLAAQP